MLATDVKELYSSRCTFILIYAAGHFTCHFVNDNFFFSLNLPLTCHMLLTQCLISVQCQWYSKKPCSPKSFLKRQFLPSHILPFWLFFSSGIELQTVWAMCLDVMKSYSKTMQKYQILQQLWQQQWQKQPNGL